MPIQIGAVMLYSVFDIADMIDVHPSTIRKYLRDNEMRGRKIAGKWYVSAGDLVRYLQGQGHDLRLPELIIEPMPLVSISDEAFEQEEHSDWRTDLETLRDRARRLRDRARRIDEAFGEDS